MRALTIPAPRRGRAGDARLVRAHGCASRQGAYARVCAARRRRDVGVDASHRRACARGYAFLLRACVYEYDLPFERLLKNSCQRSAVSIFVDYRASHVRRGQLIKKSCRS